MTFSDIDPKHDWIDKRDFIKNPHLTRRPRHEKILVIANPPFGGLCMSDVFLRNTFRFAHATAFLIPDIYRKHERGHELAQDPLWQVLYEEKLPENIFTVNGKPFAWKCILQIWIHNDDIPDIPTNHIQNKQIEPLGYQLIQKNVHNPDMWLIRRGRDAGTILEPGTKGRSKNSKWGIKLDVEWLMRKCSVGKSSVRSTTKIRGKIRGKIREVFRQYVNHVIKMEAYGSRNCLDYHRTVSALNNIVSQIKIIRK